MFTINSFSISKLNNAEITGFFINLQKAMTSDDPATLGLSEVVDPYADTLQRLIDQVYTTTGSEYTAAMLAADEKRDQTYKRIRLRLQMVDVAEDNAAIKAVKDVVKTHLLSKYGAKVPQLPYQEETAIIEGFLYDLEDKLGTEGMDALGITTDYTALEDANNAFVTAYNARSVERAEGDTGLTVKIREEMISLYMQICFITQFLANSVDDENAEKAAACQAFIGVLNVILSDVRKRYNQRTSNGSTEDDEEEGGNPDDSSDEIGDEGEGHTDATDPTDDGGSGNGSGSNGSTDSGDSQDNGGNSGSSSNPSNPSNSSNPSNPSEGGSGNTTDPNAPSESGVVNGDEVSF